MEQSIIQRARVVGAELARQLADIEHRLYDREHDKVATTASLNAALDAALDRALDGAMEQLRATGLWGPDNRIASNGFWEAAEPWLSLDWAGVAPG